MLTRSEAAAQRRAIKRDIDRDLRTKKREHLLGLRKKLGEARAHKKARLKELSERCRSERLTVREKLKEMRARVILELRETARLEREAARDACRLRRGDSKTSCRSAIECAQRDYLTEKAYQADLVRIERDNRMRHATTRTRLDRAARLGESDDEVRQNISRELVPLFDRVKRAIRATARTSRTEAFLKYAEENPHEVFAVLDEKSDRLIRSLEAQQRQTTGSKRGAGRQFPSAESSGVPF